MARSSSRTTFNGPRRDSRDALDGTVLVIGPPRGDDVPVVQGAGQPKAHIRSLRSWPAGSGETPSGEREGQVRLAAGDELGLRSLPPGVPERPGQDGTDEVRPDQVLMHRC